MAGIGIGIGNNRLFQSFSRDIKGYLPCDRLVRQVDLLGSLVDLDDRAGGANLAATGAALVTVGSHIVVNNGDVFQLGRINLRLVRYDIFVGRFIPCRYLIGPGAVRLGSHIVPGHRILANLIGQGIINSNRYALPMIFHYALGSCTNGIGNLIPSR